MCKRECGCDKGKTTVAKMTVTITDEFNFLGDGVHHILQKLAQFCFLVLAQYLLCSVGRKTVTGQPV